MTEKTTFKVAKILDEYTLIINGGSADNVHVDDTFNILDKDGSPVKDPDTDEIIGHLDLIKGTVVVTLVQERMSVCTSPERVNYKFMANLNILKGNFTYSEKERLNVDLDQLTGELGKSEEPIRVGDPAKLIKTSRRESSGE
ncbi:hypothetical protein [Edaphobacillus lindanitolerans]|uniref:Uncharacterized protein n=1 Tax=Edaphobacillus lindanitolerans TaxID=550447 RepID=A0A1U7PT99_9BACI|nr:hypothetical protein [Edaphobacillus lindanitolerans]SIT91479.1 hypothetical protein SAMN05428946_2688 [Edaphobacillus lindanitolerans]